MPLEISKVKQERETEDVALVPQTRSRKIMRRLLRAKEWGEKIGDTSTLEKE
jgi:acetyl-CoA synthetase